MTYEIYFVLFLEFKLKWKCPYVLHSFKKAVLVLDKPFSKREWRESRTNKELELRRKVNSIMDGDYQDWTSFLKEALSSFIYNEEYSNASLENRKNSSADTYIGSSKSRDEGSSEISPGIFPFFNYSQ